MKMVQRGGLEKGATQVGFLRPPDFGVSLDESQRCRLAIKLQAFWRYSQLAPPGDLQKKRHTDVGV